MLLYILNIAHYVLIFTEHCCKYRTAAVHPAENHSNGSVWTCWELHEPRDHVAARSKSVATLSFNGSGPGNKFTVNVHKAPCYSFSIGILLTFFFTLTVIWDKVCPFSAQYGTGAFVSKYGTITFFKGRLATLTLTANVFCCIKWTLIKCTVSTKILFWEDKDDRGLKEEVYTWLMIDRKCDLKGKCLFVVSKHCLSQHHILSTGAKVNKKVTLA